MPYFSDILSPMDFLQRYASRNPLPARWFLLAPVFPKEMRDAIMQLFTDLELLSVVFIAKAVLKHLYESE